MGYGSETAKFRELEAMKYVKGRVVVDWGCGSDKITPDALGVDGRKLDTVNVVVNDLENPDSYFINAYLEACDVIYSSHFLEHCRKPVDMIDMWYQLLKPGGKLILYLPDGAHYSNAGNPEHLQDWNFDNFFFWLRRCFLGEGKNYMGEHLPKYFELVDSGMDVRPDCYSFYFVLKAV